MWRRMVPLTLGLLMAAAGLLWTLQGLGYVGGSSMSGESFWAVVGPVVAGLGVALVIVGFRRGDRPNGGPNGGPNDRPSDRH